MSKSQTSLIESCFHNEVSRRDFFDRLLKAGITGAIAAVVPNAVFGAPPTQNNWRNCRKCSTLFFNGYRKGRCPAGGAHSGDNRNYKITYNSSGPGQGNWRFCNKCDAMFFNGYPNKGVCPAGGPHFAQGYNFTLRFDAQAIGEPDWRFCNKCEVIFFNRDSNVGVCAAGEGHVAQGYHFVLDDTVRID
jgi:hypothetical protein